MVKGEVFWFWFRMYGEGGGRGDLQTGGFVYLGFQVWVRRTYSDKHFDTLTTAEEEYMFYNQH